VGKGDGGVSTVTQCLLKTRVNSSVLKYPSASLRLLVGGNSPPVPTTLSAKAIYLYISQSPLNKGQR